jgi:glycerophosphoryl diester phosphodiesterase
MGKVTIIGHRGAMAYAPENTLSSFEKAVQLGAEVIEMDVHLSRDGEVAVIHDEKVNRTTNGRGLVSQMLLIELKKLRIKRTEQIPTLAEVLGKFKGRCQFNVELKGEGAALPALDIVKKCGLLKETIFSSFDGPQLVRIKGKDSRARVAFLCEEKKLNMLAIAKSLKAEAINPKKKLATPELIKNAHESGLKVNVWTVNRAPAMTKYIEMGADGIITNKPDVLKKLLSGV